MSTHLFSKKEDLRLRPVGPYLCAMEEDIQLWDRLRQGQKSALEQIYRREVNALFRYGRSIAQDEALVEDVIQDLFIQLWKRHAGLGPTDNIHRYLLVALRRALIRQLQRGQGRTLAWEEGQSSGEEAEAADAALMAEAEQAEQRQQIEQLFAQLSNREREVLHLRYIEEMEYKDIAELLGINYQSVRNLASAGLARMRKS